MNHRTGRTLNRHRAAVPTEALELFEHVSKAELLEVAWQLAGLANDAGSADDDASTRARLVEEINLLRDQRGARKLPRSLTERTDTK